MSRLTALFWNRDEARVRAGWRLLLQILLVLIAVTITLPISQLTANHPPWNLFAERTPWVMMIVTAWLAAWLLDRRALADLGLKLDRRWWFDFCFGLLVGLFLIGAVFTTAALCGWVRFRTVPVDSEFGLPLAAALPCELLIVALVAVGEEVWFRGYQLRNLAEGLCGRRIGPGAAVALAILLTAAVFAGLHLPDADSSIVSVVNTFLGGIMLGVGLACTGRLGLPIGLHLSWNFAMGCLLGLPVSGNPPRVALITIDDLGPTLWTGGEYGPEGGQLGTAAFVAAILLVLGWARYRRSPAAVRSALAEYHRPPESSISR